MISPADGHGISSSADGGTSDLTPVNDTSHVSPDGHTPETLYRDRSDDDTAAEVGNSASIRGTNSRETPPTPAPLAASYPRGEVISPARIFDARGSKLDRAVLHSNPRLYLPKNLGRSTHPVLVIGLPGWGGRSENFIQALANGLKDPTLTRRMVLASIQDTRNGGPRFQGQSNQGNANTYLLRGDAVMVMDHFIARLCQELFNGPAEVYLLGFSTGGVAAPDMASRLSPGERYWVAGAVSVGAGTSPSIERLLHYGQRVLFTVAPEERRGDEPIKSDRSNRLNAEYSFKRLQRAGVESYLVHINSARQHADWHWGLLSQCRYPNKRANGGRGYHPHYWMPNPETMSAVSSFIQGGAPVVTPAPLEVCP